MSQKDNFPTTDFNLMLPVSEVEPLKQSSGAFLSLTLTQRQICDLELLKEGFLDLQN